MFLALASSNANADGCYSDDEVFNLVYVMGAMGTVQTLGTCKVKYPGLAERIDVLIARLDLEFKTHVVPRIKPVVEQYDTVYGAKALDRDMKANARHIATTFDSSEEGCDNLVIGYEVMERASGRPLSLDAIVTMGARTEINCGYYSKLPKC